MEEKKFDIKSIIGFVLIFAILIFMMWQNQPTPEELAETEKQEQIEADKKAEAKQTKDT
jgi:YidC/Oxa1 family membrane protein insertase